MRTAVGVLTLALLFAVPSQVEACTCAQLPLCSTLSNVEAIFVARAEVLASGGGTQRARLHISTVFKGTMPQTIEVVGRGLGGSCDYAFTPNASHLVFASRERGGAWKVSLCSRTDLVDRARDDLAALNAIREKPASPGVLAGRLDPARVKTHCDTLRKRE
jgi:hypothetical protein